MGIFNELYSEEYQEGIQESHDIEFPDDISIGKLGYQGFILAETGWLVVESYLDEHYMPLSEAPIKETITKYFDKLKEILKHTWEIIKEAISKFINFIEDAATEDKISYDKNDLIKKLHDYNKTHYNKQLTFSGWLIDNKLNDKGISFIDEKINRVAKASNAFYLKAQEMEKGISFVDQMLDKEKTYKFFDDYQKIKSGAVTDISYEAVLHKVFDNIDLKATKNVKEYIKHSIMIEYDDIKISEELVSACVASCGEGYKKSVSNAKKMYNEIKKQINTYQKWCNEIEKKHQDAENVWTKIANMEEKRKKNFDQERVDQAKEYIKIANSWKTLFKNFGQMITTCSGILSQIIGGYYQYVKEDWKTCKDILDSIENASKSKDVEEKPKERLRLTTNPDAQLV